MSRVISLSLSKIVSAFIDKNLRNLKTEFGKVILPGGWPCSKVSVNSSVCT